MKTPVFVSFCMLLVVGLVSMHAIFQDSFSPVDRLHEQLKVTAKDAQAAELRSQILQAELADYQQHVATLLPGAIKDSGHKDNAYSLRQLASVADKGEGEQIEFERASGLFESAKSSFRDEDFEGSNRALEKLISSYPTSLHVAEAHFLLAEGQYQSKNFEGSVKTIEKMIDQYPENDLTGFALLRLGDIYRREDRAEDASDIYRAVLANFKQPELVRQADQNLKAVSL